MKKTKYKAIISIITIIDIILMYFFCSLNSNEVKSEEVFRYYITETTLSETNKIYVIDEKIENKINKNENVNKNININDNNDNKEEKIEEVYQQGKEKYYIKVNCLAQTVTIYEKDENGYYSVPFKAMICSTGTNTPQLGIYQITSFKEKWLALQGKVYGQYCTQIIGDILFHSVPYLEYKNPASLEYWEYDKLGEKASLGCVRLTVEDAKWIFENCEEGTKVEFYSSENPGLLGKPTIEKISQYDELKNWDPTDEKEKNPWKQYLETKNKKMKQVVTTINEITKYMKI